MVKVNETLEITHRMKKRSSPTYLKENKNSKYFFII